MSNLIKYSIGEVSKLSGVTIRTLQYYDNIGLLPIEKDESGRRYYSSGDLAKLQQVLFYRSLGLPLKEIRELVVDLATTEQITTVLTQQKEAFLHKLNEIQSYISLIDAVLAGVKSGGTFQSDELLQLITRLNRNAVFEYRNAYHNEETKALLMEKYGDAESTLAIYWQWKAIILECVSLILSGVKPRSEAGKTFAQKWLTMIERLTQGSSELLEAHQESYANRDQWPEEDRRLMEFADPFIDEAITLSLGVLATQALIGLFPESAQSLLLPVTPQSAIHNLAGMNPSGSLEAVSLATSVVVLVAWIGVTALIAGWRFQRKDV